MSNNRVVTNFTLKCIALACMVIDHVGILFFPMDPAFRIVGRISFPIFCFLIVEGYFHTGSLSKYMWRLVILALLSEMVYDWAFYHMFFYWGQQNIFFTLLIGLAAVALIDKSPAAARKGLSFMKINRHSHRPIEAVATVVLILLTVGGAMIALAVIRPSYQYLGLAMILAFYFFRDRLWLLTAAVFAINYLGEGGLQTYACLAMVPIWFYNGRRGINIKYVFYLFYPVHLFILALLASGVIAS